MVNQSPLLEREEYPGELRELRAVLAAIAKRGCLECQLRASVAASCVVGEPTPHQLLALHCAEHRSW
jgi:hypothetical protein